MATSGWNTTALQRATRATQLHRKLWYGVKGGWQQAWETYLKGDAKMRDVLVVFDLIVGGGKRIRMAAEEGSWDFTDPSGASKERIAVEPWIVSEPEIEQSYTFGSGSSSARSFGITIETLHFDPWELVQRYGRFLAGWGEIALIGPGMDWSDRLIVMRGDMTGGVSFGATRERMDVKLADPKLTADLGVTEYVTDSDRFSDIPDSGVGQRFPLAINSPPATPIIRVTDTAPPTFLVCYGHECDVSAVYVDGESYATSSTVYPWSVQYLFDGLGTPYTGVVFTAGTGAWEDNTTVYADLAPRSTSRSRNVVETIRYLAEEWSILGPIGVNDEVFARALAKVQSVSGNPGIYINGSGDDDATGALDYIESTICGSFPMISMAWQVGGYGPVLTDRRRPAVAKWTVGQAPLQKRVGDWTESAKENLYNWFTVRYGYDPLNDTYAGVVTRNPDNSLLCRLSEEQTGPRDMDPLETTLISDSSTAEWVADWLVAHYTIPSYTADYLADPDVILKYRLGDNIDLVDTEIYGCSDSAPVRATIEKISYKRGSCTVGLRLWPLYPYLTAATTLETEYVGTGSGGN